MKLSWVQIHVVPTKVKRWIVARCFFFFQLINKVHSHQEAPYEPHKSRRAQVLATCQSADGRRDGHRRSFQVRRGPFHTCISEPLDRPRALASSVVKPLFSVLLTVANRKWIRKKWVGLLSAGGSFVSVQAEESSSHSRDFRLTRERLLSRGCVRWLGPWVAERTIRSMISSAVSSVPFTRSSAAAHQGATRPDEAASHRGQCYRRTDKLPCWTHSNDWQRAATKTPSALELEFYTKIKSAEVNMLDFWPKLSQVHMNITPTSQSGSHQSDLSALMKLGLQIRVRVQFKSRIKK